MLKKTLLAIMLVCALTASAPAQTVDPTVVDVLKTIYSIYNYSKYRENPNPYNAQYPLNYEPYYNNNGYNYNNTNNNGYYYNNGYTPSNAAGYYPGLYDPYNQGYTPVYNQASPLDVNFTNLSDGSTVPSSFMLTGQTRPYARVTLDGQSAVQNGGNRSFKSQVVADARGLFGVQVDASNVAYGSTIYMRAQAAGPEGGTGPVRTLQVTRR